MVSGCVSPHRDVGTAVPEDLRMFVPVAIRAFMDRLAPRVQAAAAVSLRQIVDLNPRIPERIMAGEAFDIALTNPTHARALVASGHADGATHFPFGRVPLAIARRAGTDHPVRTDMPGVAALLRDAESIAYTGAGTSGRSYLDAVARLGLTDTVLSRSRPMGGGEPVASVADGTTELAIAPLSTVLSTPGVIPAAVFPDVFGAAIEMSVLLGNAPGAGAAAVLAFLTASDLDAELAAAGLVRFALD